MRILHDFAMHGQRAPSLAVLLPGALQQPEEFVSAGFVDAVRRRKLPLDLTLLDPGLQFIGEAADGTALRRIHDGVMQPARREHYEQIWLVGISIGGFMTIAYAERYPGLATGLCLLAPYPGNRIVTNEIAAAGGLLTWQPENLEPDDAERRVWHWMKAPPAGMQIHLGYGRDDRFATGHRLMAEALAQDCVDTTAGGHTWPVWLQLWENFLDRQTFPTEAANLAPHPQAT